MYQRCVNPICTGLYCPVRSVSTCPPRPGLEDGQSDHVRDCLRKILSTATVAFVRNTAVRLTIVAAFAVIGLSAGIASGAPVSAQTPVVTGTIAASPASTGPDSTVQVTAVFTPSVTLPNYRVSINLTGTNGQGTIVATPVSTTSGLSSCVIDSVQRSMDCNWLTDTAIAQTLVVTVNVGSGATPSTTNWQLTANAAPDNANLVELDRTSIEILAEYAGTATALCDGGDQPVTEARNTGAKDLTFVREGTGFPLPAGESITVNWPNGTDGAPIPVLDWRMLIPGFTTVVESGTLQLPDCAPSTTAPTTTIDSGAGVPATTAPTTTIGSGAGVPATTAPVALPETGADTTMLALLASVMLMAGGAAVAVARRTS